MVVITFFKDVAQLVINRNCITKSFAAQNLRGACAPCAPPKSVAVHTYVFIKYAVLDITIIAFWGGLSTFSERSEG